MKAWSEKSGMRLVCKIVSGITGQAISPRKMAAGGWYTNQLVVSGAPCLWRSNACWKEDKFWEVLSCVLNECGCVGSPVVFHEGHGGWRTLKAPVSRFVAFESAGEAVSFLRNHAYYRKSDWQYGRANDDYAICDQESSFILFLTHHGEMLAFCYDLQVLVKMQRCFRRSALRARIE